MQECVQDQNSVRAASGTGNGRVVRIVKIARILRIVRLLKLAKFVM
jgi:hypothetical protein